MRSRWRAASVAPASRQTSSTGFGPPIRAKMSDKGWVPDGGRMGLALQSGRRCLTRGGRRTEGRRAPRIARLANPAASRYSSSFALMTSSDAGRDSLLRGCPPQRGTAVFENSTACASTIENRSWCASRFDPPTGALCVHGGGTKSQVGVVPRHGAEPRCIGFV